MSKKVIDLTEVTSPQSDDTIYVTRNPSASPIDRKMTFDNLVNFPYGSFSSNADQTCTAGTTADAITYSTTDTADGINLSDSSHINIPTAGTYLITFSAVCKTATPNAYVEIWMAVDGTPVDNSNTITRFIGSANERIVTVTFIYNFTAGQYFQLFMWSDYNTTKLEATGTQVNPTRPACPSIIVTVNKIGS